MDILKLIILVFSLFLSVKAQVTSNQHDANSLHPSMAVVLTVLTIMFFLSFLALAYAKFCNDNNNRPNEAQDPNGNGIVISSRFSGIDKTIIESLPFFQFSSLKGTKEGLECAVCLSKFEDTEILRLLPKCQHAFHMNCIDAWLENHSSCPICRNKFDVGDLKSFTCTNSFRRSTSGDEPNLEFFIDREKNLERSARFSVSSAIQKLARVKREEPLIQDRRMLHNVKHRIIASDVICKSRWSDVNSSDMLSLNSEMLNFMSSNRFSSAEFNSKRSSEENSAKREILNIKADSEKVKVSGEASNWAGSSNVGLHETAVSKLLDASQQRSMSEINNVSRFNQFSALRRVNMEKDEKVRRLWLPIAKRTIQRFAGRETSSDATKHVLEIRHQEDDRV